MPNEKVLDILKIQKTIRKAIKDYTIVAKHDEEVLISLVSVDLYLNLTNEDIQAPLKRKPPTPHSEVVIHGQAAECN